MGNVIACVNEPLLNFFLRSNDMFNGQKSFDIASMILKYQAVAPPFFELHNQLFFTITIPEFEIELSHLIRGKIASDRFQLQFGGEFVLQPVDNKIILNIREGGVSGGNRISRTMLHMYINREIIPMLQKQLPKVNLPDLKSLIGFDVVVEKLLIYKRFLCLHMNVVGDAIGEDAQLKLSDTSEPSVFLAATDAALSTSQRDFLIKLGIDHTEALPVPVGASAGVSGYAQASNLSIVIQQGQPTCKVSLSAVAALRMNFKYLGKVNLGLSPSITPPNLSFILLNQKNTVKAAFQVDSRSLIGWRVKSKLPFVMKGVINEILAWVDASTRMVSDTLDGGLRTFRFSIFSLDHLKQDVSIKAIGFYENSVTVHVVVDVMDNSIYNNRLKSIKS